MLVDNEGQAPQTTYDAQEEARKKKQQGLGPDGRPIPNAGVYGQEQANVELAWQNANTTAENRLKSFQNHEGVLADGSVDPRNQYGGYQQLLHNQGSELDQAQESAMGRGLGGGPGLGNQAERGLRYGHAIQNLRFQSGLTAAQANYGMELGQADAQRRSAMTSALQNALNNAWGDWTPPEMGTPTPDPSPGGPTPDPYPGNKPKKQYRPGQAPTSLAVINNHLNRKPKPQYRPGQAPTSLAVKNNTSKTRSATSALNKVYKRR